jgi:D-alanyl-D-alanine carboxypeptidase
MLTAIMIYQLIDNNKLELDRKIDTYFPDIPNADKISISHLLGHSSGLKDYVVKNDTLYFWLLQPVTEQEIMDEIVGQGIDFQPGEKVQYSNSGYYLLARILEKEYGEKYEDILLRQIISPLKLKDTKSNIDYNDVTVAKPYHLTTDRAWEEMEDFYFSNVIGLGDVVSTPEDLNTILLSLYAGQLIDRTNIDMMKPIEGNRFGKGLMRVPFYEHTFYGHGGDTFGTHSLVVYNESDSLAIALCINGLEFSLDDMMINLLSIIYKEDFELPQLPDNLRMKGLNIDYALYEGTYSSPELPIKIRIFRKDNNLMLQATGQPSTILEAVSNQKFRILSAKVEIEFDSTQKQLILKQHGQEFILPKE